MNERVSQTSLSLSLCLSMYHSLLFPLTISLRVSLTVVTTLSLAGCCSRSTRSRVFSASDQRESITWEGEKEGEGERGGKRGCVSV